MRDYSSVDMTAAKKIKSLIKEAQLYHSQGLLKEARKRFEAAAELVENDDTLSEKSQIIEGIQKKLQSLEAVTYRVEKKTHITEISPRDKDLIKRLFSSAETEDKDASTLEGAVALAKFGQFDRAISEFEDLLENSHLRFVAAKHILRCHMALRALHDPMAQFQKWVATGYFEKEELAELSVFLERTYGLSVTEQTAPTQQMNGGVDRGTESPNTVTGTGQAAQKEKEPDFDPYEDEYVDILDVLNSNGGKGDDDPSKKSANGYVDIIGESSSKKKTFRYEDLERNNTDDYVDYVSSLGIPMKTGEIADMPVNLQTGSVVNVIVPAKMKNVMEVLKKGARIEGVKLSSPISSNTGDCIVVSAARIDMGPKRGEYSVDLRIEG